MSAGGPKRVLEAEGEESRGSTTNAGIAQAIYGSADGLFIPPVGGGNLPEGAARPQIMVTGAVKIPRNLLVPALLGTEHR